MTQFFKLKLNLWCNLHFAVLFLQLVYMMSFEVGIGEEPSTNSLESSVGNRKEDATKVDDVAWIHEAGKISIYMNCHGSRDVPNGHLIGLIFT